MVFEALTVKSQLQRAREKRGNRDKTPIMKINYSGSQQSYITRIFNLGRLKKKTQMITSSGHYGVTGPRLLFLL